jgi:hypothetical protein
MRKLHIVAALALSVSNRGFRPLKQPKFSVM